MWDRFFYLHLTHNRFFYLSLLTGDTESVYVFEVDTVQTGSAPEIIFTENVTNYDKLNGTEKKNVSKCMKDSFHEYVIKGMLCNHT